MLEIKVCIIMELLIIHVVDLAQPSKDVFLHINGSVKWDRVLIIKATVGIGVVEMEFSLSLITFSMRNILKQDLFQCLKEMS